jgi:S1-C subfamily serine protease
MIVLSRWSSAHGADNFAALYQRIKPSVVYVVVATSTGAQSGSGFVYQSDTDSSLIITANHVVEGAQRIDVILNSDLHQRYAATVVKYDHVKDVALLRIDVGGLTKLSLAKASSIEEGETVAVIGYPRVAQIFERIDGDDLRPSVHTGIISAIRLNGEIIQYDAITDHGDSGGPVIDISTGQVVAIVHGAIPDPSYAARGLEQALPGSGYGMSSATIAAVTSGAQHSVAVGSGSPQPMGGAGESSAAYRVGLGLPLYTDPTVQAISGAVLQRLIDHFQQTNAFYVIPSQFGITAEDAQIINGNCEDERLNALMAPQVRWNFKGQYIPGMYDGRVAEVWVDLLVTDCSGAPFYYGEKTKWEYRQFANRDPNTEVIDMSNDMLDQLIKGFDDFVAQHEAAWDSLLKTGIGIDPNDGKYHALFYPYPDKAGIWHIWTVFPGGPADRAGVKKDDVIESIDSINISGWKPEDVAPLFNKSSYVLTLKRPGGDVTVTVMAAMYPELLKMVQH